MPWKTIKLREICTKIYSGGTPRTSIKKYYEEGAIPWLNTKEINFCRIHYTKQKITKAGLDNSSAKWVPANAIIIAMYGATAGKVAISKIPLTTNQACCNLIVDGGIADYSFVYYSIVFRYGILAGLANGGAQQNLNAGIIKDFNISLPPLHEQKRISGILGALDDKIELNRKMNENLEQQAVALFKHWFIDFEFPDAKGKPYRSSGGKMKDSPLGLIPDEWEVGSLEDLSQTNVASLSNSDDYDFINYLDTGSITDNHISSYQKLLKGVDKFPSRAKRKVRKNNIVYSLVRPNQRHFGIITEPEDNMIASTGFAVIEAKCHCAHFIYFYLIREECIKHLQAIAEQSVSTYPTLRPSDIENLQVVLPPQALLIQFENMATSLVHKISKNHIENRLLSKKRDNLIPELMNK